MTTRPRERRKERTREQILDAARDLVIEGGHERLSLRAVARRADYSPAGLYEYFDGREALLEALAARGMARFGAALARADEAAGGRTAAERLVALGESYVAFARANPEDFLLLFGRLPSVRRSTDEGVSAGSPYRFLLAAAGALLADAGVDEDPARAAETAAYGLWALAHGLAMLRVTHLRDFEADFDRGDRVALEAYVRGLTR